MQKGDNMKKRIKEIIAEVEEDIEQVEDLNNVLNDKERQLLALTATAKSFFVMVRLLYAERGAISTD